MVLPSSENLILGLRDIGKGFTDWHVWGRLGWQDVRQRYRRSTLGPFWLTVSMGVTVAAIGLIWANLFNMDRGAFIPHLCLGILIWNFLIIGVLIEGSKSFINAANLIKQIPQSLSSLVFMVVWRNVIVFFHGFLVYFAVVAIFGVELNATLIWVLPGSVLLLLNVSWMALLLGTFAARFRDIPEIVQNVLIVAFFLTPIMYKREQLGRASFIADFNPLAHLVDLVRAPLLGHAPSSLNWIVAGGMLVIGSIITVVLFSRFRGRIAYWI